MKHLTIIVPNGQNNLSSIVGSYKIFKKANAYLEHTTGEELFKIELAGLCETVDFYDGFFTVKPHKNIENLERTDLIIIPSLNHNYQTALEGNKPIIQWIAKQYKQGAEVASICTGAFLLASTGILDGKSCSTNWAVADNFRSMFPKVNLQIDKLITDQSGIYTNGGAYSFLNLIIYLIEKYYNRETAVYCSKIFQIEIDRQSQSTFMIFKGQKSHEDDMVLQAQEYIESQVHQKISIEHLSSKFPVGRRNFDRRFIKATGNTPFEYSQRVKMEMAKKALETSRKTINEVIYDVGYSDVKAFRNVFIKITGLSPLAYKTKYNKEAIISRF
ncbi:GlxA family transcriptional regulator [Galbibacter sp.]|uniref:GlxA family transcriptional regulator n=1 Tax=Galbibacter sp. TaxID=2918471 RepID=UPI003A949BBF